jgi:AcrR family transcriptional regulator
MPRLVDATQRRAAIAEAVWTVIRRDGLQRASVRNVAREAGLSMGSLRHYFSTQSELLCFAMELVGERARARVRALQPASDPRRTAERLLFELVPLDDERRAESEVWLAYTGQALVDPDQRAIHQRIHDQLHGACTTAITLLADAALPPPRTSTSPWKPPASTPSSTASPSTPSCAPRSSPPPASAPPSPITSTPSSQRLRLPEGDEVEHEHSTELLDRLIHQVVEAAAPGLDLEREPAGPEPDRMSARLVRRILTKGW